MKTLTKSKHINDFTIKDVFADSREHSIRRIIQDSNEKVKEDRKTQTSSAPKTFEEKVLMK